MKNFFKKLLFNISLYSMRGFFRVFILVKMEVAGGISSSLTMIIGALHPSSKTAYKNLKIAMPELTKWQKIKIIMQMWYNFGAIAGEYPNIFSMNKNEIFKYVSLSLDSKKNMQEIKNLNTGAILFSAHIGNWEVGLRALVDFGIPVKVVYRAFNDKKLDKEFVKLREINGVEMIEKGKKGASTILKELKSGTKIIMLMDQRLSEGVEADFFGIKCKTPDSLGIFAKRFDVPIYPLYVERRKDQSSLFNLIIENKFITGESIDKNDIAQEMNNTIEKWVRKNPGQWFWAHDRWKE